MRVTAFLAALVVSFVHLHAQPAVQNSAVQNEAQGKAVLQRAFAAMGCDKLGPETPITVTGTLTPAGGTAMPLTISSQGDDRWRSELDTPKGHKTTIINGGRGEMHRSDGKVQKLAEHNTSHQRPFHIPCLVVLSHPSGRIKATFLRTEAGTGDSFDVVEILPSGHPNEKWATDRMKETLWISRTNGYLTKLRYTNGAEQDSNDALLVTIEYSDFRLTAGIAQPFHQVTSSGHTTLDFQINSVDLNTAAADFRLEVGQ